MIFFVLIFKSSIFQSFFMYSFLWFLFYSIWTKYAILIMYLFKLNFNFKLMLQVIKSCMYRALQCSELRLHIKS